MTLLNPASIDPNIRRLLLLRTDAIGDNVLALGMLPPLAERFPGAHIVVACQELAAPLYARLPMVHQIITFNPRKLKDPAYWDSIVQQLQNLHADVCLSTQYTWEHSTDDLALHSGAAITVAHAGATGRTPSPARAAISFTALIESPATHAPELERHKDFLRGLGIVPGNLLPRIAPFPEEQATALELLRRHDLDPRRTLVLFSVGHFVGGYRGFGPALANICREQNLRVVSLGLERDADPNQVNLSLLPNRPVNLCGKTSLAESIEILRACRLAVGVDTGLAHLATAVNTPSVVLLGGGHFGRFLPYSPLTTTVSVPLACYHCDWKCDYAWSHCIHDIAPEVVETAVRETLKGTLDRPRVFIQDQSLTTALAAGPRWVPGLDQLAADSVHYVRVASPAAREIPIPPGLSVQTQYVTLRIQRSSLKLSLRSLSLRTARKMLRVLRSFRARQPVNHRAVPESLAKNRPS